MGAPTIYFKPDRLTIVHGRTEHPGGYVHQGYDVLVGHAGGAYHTEHSGELAVHLVRSGDQAHVAQDLVTRLLPDEQLYAV